MVASINNLDNRIYDGVDIVGVYRSTSAFTYLPGRDSLKQGKGAGILPFLLR
jgi:hypothetical protein